MHKNSTNVAKNASSETVTVVGIDLVKNVFAIHGIRGINAAGRPVLAKPSMRRDQVRDVLAQLSPCIIGMKACTGAHHWARQLMKLGISRASRKSRVSGAVPASRFC